LLISGLDSQSAYNIIRFLRKLAQAGQAILCTIHQPNDSLFEQFDRLLLLERGGRTVYFGEIGTDACVLRDYFKRNGAECPPRHNPAEFMLETIGAGSRRRVGDRDWADIWNDSPEFEDVKKQIVRIKEERKAADLDLKSGKGEYATPLLYQVRVVLRRMNVTFWRTPNYGTTFLKTLLTEGFTRLYVHVVIAFFTGVMFWQLGNTATDLQYRIFAIFQAAVLPAFIISQVEPQYDMSRLIFIRESSSKMYSQFAFVFSIVIAEIPYGIIAVVAVHSRNFFLMLVFHLLLLSFWIQL
jgi:ATP-binding cassette, subfamily G (WHITE), member 2, SNQ2